MKRNNQQITRGASSQDDLIHPHKHSKQPTIVGEQLRSLSLESELPGTAGEQLVHKHKQHLRDLNELNKMEGKLLVDYTVKSKTDAGMSFEKYVEQLNVIMQEKTRVVAELSAHVRTLI